MTQPSPRRPPKPTLDPWWTPIMTTLEQEIAWAADVLQRAAWEHWTPTSARQRASKVLAQLTGLEDALEQLRLLSGHQKIERLLTFQEAADYLRLTTETIRRHVKIGRLPALRIGGGRNAPMRFHQEDLDSLNQSKGQGER